MPLRTVAFVKDHYYHIYNRGSEKRVIFLETRDYLKFLTRLQENSQKYRVDILCYCLMPNHFHLLVKQTSDTSITIFMNVLQLSYSKFFNTKYQRVGPLFQGRFKAKIVETDEYLLQLSAYIHRNPLALHTIQNSGNLEDPRNQLHLYPYSSYKEYIKIMSRTITKPDFILSYFSTKHKQLSYESFVENFIPPLEELLPIIF